MALDRNNTIERNKQLNLMYTELSKQKVWVKVPGRKSKIQVAIDHDSICDQLAKLFFLKRRTVDEILGGAYEKRWQHEDQAQQPDPNQMDIFDLPGVEDPDKKTKKK